MAAPSVTYTFSNSTVADATQVNTNLQDLIDACSDGTSDFVIGSLEVVGATVLDGNITFGTSTSDDITWTGSLASDILIKTNNIYNIGGSALGLAGVYFSSASSKTTKVAFTGGSSNITWTFPGTVAGGAGEAPVASDTSGNFEWRKVRRGDAAHDLQNHAISATVGSNNLTIALKTKAGSDASSTDTIYVSFRNATATTGTYAEVAITGSMSLVVPSGATLGHSNGTAAPIYVYLLNNAGTAELACSSTLFDENTINTSTTIDTNADSISGIYSTTGRSNVAFRYIGRLKSIQATAGTWATTPSETATNDLGNTPAGATSSGLITNTAQTIAGAKTFSGIATFSSGLVLGNETLTVYDEDTNTVVANAATEGANADMTVYVTRIGRQVVATFDFDSDITPSGTSLTFAALIPSGFRPSATMSFEFHYFTGSAWNTGALTVASDGGVEVFRVTSEASWSGQKLEAGSSRPFNICWNIY